jgi:hypothetical protein
MRRGEVSVMVVVVVVVSECLEGWGVAAESCRGGRSRWAVAGTGTGTGRREQEQEHAHAQAQEQQRGRQLPSTDRYLGRGHKDANVRQRAGK